MSAINGDKGRASRQRSHKLREREKTRALRKALAARPPMPAPSKTIVPAESAAPAKAAAKDSEKKPVRTKAGSVAVEP